MVTAITEEEGAQKGFLCAQASCNPKRRLTIASTGADANGNLITQEYHVEGPTALITTTTAIDVDEELMNRCMVLAVDEGREQTRAIHARRQAEACPCRVTGKAGEAYTSTAPERAAPLPSRFAWLTPYADRLTFLDDRTRTRRDHEKYLTLIDTIALLHQHQRPVRTLSQGESSCSSYIEATAQDITKAARRWRRIAGALTLTSCRRRRSPVAAPDPADGTRGVAPAYRTASKAISVLGAKNYGIPTGIGDTAAEATSGTAIALPEANAHLHRGELGLNTVYERALCGREMRARIHRICAA